MLKQELSYEAGKAYQEITDRLYTIAEEYGLGDDWVQEKATELATEVETATGVDLTQA